MGRHGGGSRSGGRSGGSSRRSGGGSRSGDSGTRVSKTPFVGCYNRSYYDRCGRYHHYYTSNNQFGTKSGWNIGIIFVLCFVTIHMFLMLSGFIPSLITFGSKVNGDKSRIFIQDNIDILTKSEEKEILSLLEDVYDKSGMPVTLYTDDFSWKDHYYSLDIYSEELYYNIGFDEDAMIILFTTETTNDFNDWEYDMYCGDDTIKCLSDATFNKLLDDFQKGMSSQDLTKALDYAWGSVINDLAKTQFHVSGLFIVLMICAFYGIFYVSILSSVKKENDAYRYFQENPDKLSTGSMNDISIERNAKKCAYCGVKNTITSDTCSHCGHQLL